MSKEVQSPCITCRYGEICSDPDLCHAVKYFVRTGNPITPPRRYPGTQIEKQEKPVTKLVPKPRINRQRPAFTNVHLQALAGLAPPMEKK